MISQKTYSKNKLKLTKKSSNTVRVQLWFGYNL